MTWLLLEFVFEEARKNEVNNSGDDAHNSHDDSPHPKTSTKGTQKYEEKGSASFGRQLMLFTEIIPS